MKSFELWIAVIFGSVLLLASWQKLLPIPMIETLGFLTGVFCVYLVVKENIWNFPIGIANNIFFLILFAKARLFGDAGLQIIYLILGFHGWYQWLYAGENRTPIRISRASVKTMLVNASVVIAATIGLVFVLQAMNGAAPIMDAFTTVLSLSAQYFLNRKFIENWYLWILADVIYVILYLRRGLYLTSILYLVFLSLCLVGLLSWSKTLKNKAVDWPEVPAHG